MLLLVAKQSINNSNSKKAEAEVVVENVTEQLNCCTDLGWVGLGSIFSFLRVKLASAVSEPIVTFLITLH